MTLGTLANCTTRHIAQLFLKDPSADFLVASHDAHEAVKVSHVFHESRAPSVSHATLNRVRLGCGQKDAAAVAADKVLLPPQQLECVRLYVADLFLLGATMAIIHTVPSAAAAFVAARTSLPLPQLLQRTFGLLPQQQERLLQQQSHSPSTLMRAVRGGEESVRGLPEWERGGKEGGMGGGMEGGTGGAGMGAGGSKREGSPPVRRPAFAPRCVCSVGKVLPLAQHPHARNTIIDKDLGIVYCAVEKAACTSIKMLVRSLKNLSDPTDYTKAHVQRHSGLTYLWPDFLRIRNKLWKEAEAISYMTRRDFVKVVFVRNPFTRLLSAYLDKHAMGSSLDGKEDANGRAFWNKQMFGAVLGQMGYTADARTWSSSAPRWGVHLSFRQFVHLVNALARIKLPRVDPHLATQTDLCRLGAIKYDFVGHLESLEADTDALLALLTRHTGINASAHRYVFGFGQRVHHTRAQSRLRAYYDAVTFEIVQRLYEEDMNNTLNGIKYSAPDILRDEFG